MAMGKKRIKQVCSQFQGSKKSARKQAFLEREEKRRGRNAMLLPTLSNVPRELIVIPDRSLRVPVLDAVINGVLPPVSYRDYPQPADPIILPFLIR
jgi:hypothetical protein